MATTASAGAPIIVNATVAPLPTTRSVSSGVTLRVHLLYVADGVVIRYEVAGVGRSLGLSGDVASSGVVGDGCEHAVASVSSPGK